MPATARMRGLHAWAEFLVLGVAVLMAVIDKLAGLGGCAVSGNQYHLDDVISEVQSLILVSDFDQVPGLGCHDGLIW